MQKQEKKFSAGHSSSFWIKLSFGIGHPPAIHQIQCICVGEGSRVPNLQTEFNYLDSFKSYGIFSDFVVPMVPMLSPSSTSSPCHPRHPHIIPIAPRRSPCGLNGCGLRCLHPMLSPCCPRGPRVVPVIPTSSLCRPCHPRVVPIAPRRSPCGLHGCGLRGLRCLHPMLSPCCPRGPHVVPVIPTSSPCHPHHPHVV